MTTSQLIGFALIAGAFSLPAIYVIARLVALAWYRSKAEYDRKFTNRKGP